MTAAPTRLTAFAAVFTETLGFVAGVDALHDELKGRGCPIEAAPKDVFYGMREMSVRDPDRNRVTFGEAIKA